MKRIAVLLPNWLGDAVMCTPAIRALYRRFPQAEITAVGLQASCDLVEGLPYTSRRIVVPPRVGLVAMLRTARSIRPFARDLAVILPHSFRAALLAFLSGAHRRVGYARDRRSFLLTDPVQPAVQDGRIQPVYMVREYLGLVSGLGCEDDGLGPELHADPESINQVRRRVAGAGPLVGIAPGAAFGPSKQWPVDRFAALADRLHEVFKARCVILTGPGEEDTRKALLDTARYPLLSYDEGNPSIRLLKALASQLDLLICNDSGPRHVAVAFRVPVVCIMGPTSPLYSEGPYERGERIRIDVDCGPCQKPVCETDHRCMTGISVERVFQAAEKYLPRCPTGS